MPKTTGLPRHQTETSVCRTPFFAPLPFLDQVVHLVTWLERAQPEGKVLVVLCFGLADLAVMDLEVPGRERGAVGGRMERC